MLASAASGPAGAVRGSSSSTAGTSGGSLGRGVSVGGRFGRPSRASLARASGSGRAGRAGGSSARGKVARGSGCGRWVATVSGAGQSSAGVRVALAASTAPGVRGTGVSRGAVTGTARTIFSSTTISVGPPIISRCSTLSRRTSTSRRRPSTGAASTTARRGARPRVAAVPIRDPPKRRISQNVSAIRPRTITKATMKRTISDPSVPNRLSNMCGLPPPSAYARANPAMWRGRRHRS